MAAAANTTNTQKFHEVTASLMANVRFRALKQNLKLVKKKVKVTADDFNKHANSHYSDWFHTKRGHEEAQKELRHLCDIIKSHQKDCWGMLLDSIKNRVFFVHVLYTYILEVHESEEEVCTQLQTHIYHDIEEILQQQAHLFKELAMESLQRRSKVCNAVLHVMKDDALAEDYGLTIHHGIPMIRATSEAYDLLRKHFPHRNITKESNLESLLDVIEGEIAGMEKNLQDKTKEAQNNEQMLDMMKLVANQLRRQLEQKEMQFQTLVKKVDGIDVTMKTVLEEIRCQKDDKISNIQVSQGSVASSTTEPKVVENDTPGVELENLTIDQVKLSGAKNKDV